MEVVYWYGEQLRNHIVIVTIAKIHPHLFASFSLFGFLQAINVLLHLSSYVVFYDDDLVLNVLRLDYAKSPSHKKQNKNVIKRMRANEKKKIFRRKSTHFFV